MKPSEAEEMADVGERLGARRLANGGRCAIGLMFHVHRRDRYNYRATVRAPDHVTMANRDAPTFPSQFESKRR